jgi:hypothetical protein
VTLPNTLRNTHGVSTTMEKTKFATTKVTANLTMNSFTSTLATGLTGKQQDTHQETNLVLSLGIKALDGASQILTQTLE